MIAIVIAVCLFFSVMAEGAPGVTTTQRQLTVTSHPEGNLQIRDCDVAESLECIGNVQFKSILVCAPDEASINAYTYSISLLTDAEGSRVDILPNSQARLEYTNDAEETGATATTLQTPNVRCREILIRFWSLPEDMSSASVEFSIKRRFFFSDVVIRRVSFLVSHGPGVPVTAPISEASTGSNSPSAEPTTENVVPAASAYVTFRRNAGGLDDMWQCTCSAA